MFRLIIVGIYLTILVLSAKMGQNANSYSKGKNLLNQSANDEG